MTRLSAEEFSAQTTALLEDMQQVMLEKHRDADVFAMMGVFSILMASAIATTNMSGKDIDVMLKRVKKSVLGMRQSVPPLQ